MHIGSADAFTFAETARVFIEQCDYYFGEIDLHESQTHRTPSDFLMDNGISIRGLIGEKKFDKAAKIIQKVTGIELSGFNRMYPILVVNLIAEHLLRSEYEVSLDQYLWSYAEERDKEMGGIESYTEQLRTLRSVDIEDQIRQFNHMWRNIGKFRKQLFKLSALYRQGDIHGLYKVSTRDLGVLKHIFLTERNEIMTERIIRRLDKRTFYAIGAGHLGGSAGVLRLLKEKGISCAPISVRPSN